MIHNISYRAFVYGTENQEKVETGIKTLFPSSSPQSELTEGYYKNSVLILSDKITKKRETRNFVKILNELPVPDKKRISHQLENKIDDNGNLFLRFDKQRAYLGDLKVVEHGDSIHVKIKIAAYPAKKEIALKLAREMFEI
ncbi:RNA-binding protein [Methanobacterium congolense]|uniref:RNA-binding protein PAB1135 n=1 Tax=Methanobacterium congolense TaxID=118062 RepID=A0A1D3L063_9EURY|nr:RNA-binding protein [Methanobacterium congolense]SCG85042.1 RNA-binding protein PAB1135 [Methanobacterium congolense]